MSVISEKSETVEEVENINTDNEFDREVVTERMTLRRQRDGLVSHFTKLEKTIREKLHVSDSGITLDKDIKDMKDNLDKLALRTLDLKNLARDPTESEEAETYYLEIKQRYEQLLGDVKEWKDKQITKDGKPVIDDVKPGDSVSQVAGSHTSSTASSRLRAAAKVAALRIRAEALKKQQNIKRELVEIQLREESFQLETDVAAAEAEQQVYDQMSGVSHRPGRGDPQKGTSKLNPLVNEWQGGDGLKTENTSQKVIDRLDRFEPLQPVDGSGSAAVKQEMLDMIHLPKTELMKFEGDPLKYWIFVRSFDNCIGATSISDNAKLTRLLQYCSGKALSVIECCAVMTPEQGYREARNILHERFGNEYVISKAWIQKVTEGSQLRYGDSASLRQYADSVKSCIVTLSAKGRITEVDNQARMSRMVEKLPSFLQGRWRKEAVGHLKHHGIYPDITQLARFIEAAADEANDPVFGNFQSDTKGKPQRNNASKGRMSSFQTSVKRTIQPLSSNNRPNCMCCSGDHAIYTCNKFKQWIPDARLRFIMDHRLCFNCFSRNHMSYACTKRSMCQIDGCSRKHSTLLHQALQNSYGSESKGQFAGNGRATTDQQVQSTKSVEEQGTQTFSTHNSLHGINGAGVSRIALPVVPVCVMVDGQRLLNTYAFLDSGSTNSFCSKELFEQLGLQGTKASLSLTTLTSERCQSETTCVTLDIADINGKNQMQLPYVFVIPKLPVPASSLTTQSDVDKWPHMHGILLPVLEQARITILIGQDNPAALAPLDVLRGNPDEPYAVRTVFGWTFNGPLEYGKQSTVTSNCYIQVEQDLQSCVERFWKLDHGEFQLDGAPQMSVQDTRVLDIWEKGIEIENGHYSMPIPFKCETPVLPNDYCMAEARLESLARKLVKNDSLHEKYTAGIKDLIDKNYAEKVVQDTNPSDSPVWYLPHHAVTSEKKPDKLRIVFDCSAKYMGTSLNEEVLQGPDLTNKLIGVLLRFRRDHVGIMGDIEAMYHQVKVDEWYRDALRFLWWPDGDLSLQPEMYRMTVHLFGGIWSPSCASYAVKRTAQDNSSDFDPETIKTVLENMYVDDCLKSVESESKAIHLLKELCDLLQKGGFNITKWVSNNRAVLESVPLEKRAKQVKDIDLSNGVLPQERALGVVWDTESDNFGFAVKPKEKAHTRRGLISVISSVYDPFGFVCPVIMKAKKLFQNE